MIGRRILPLLIPTLLALPAAVGYFPLSGNVIPESGSSPESKAQLIFNDGLVTVRAKDCSLSWLLNELSRKSGVAVLIAEGVGEERLSIDFNKLPAEEALRQILHEYDAFFFYSGEELKPAALRVVWVYPKGQGQGLHPVPPEEWPSTKEIEERLGDPDPEGRARAIEALIDRKGEQAVKAVLKALEDPEARVRTRALYHAFSAGLEIPQDVLIGRALSDSSAIVRFLALEALATGPDAQWIAQRALSDPSPDVQQRAQEILRGLEEASRPRKSAPPAQGQRPPQH